MRKDGRRTRLIGRWAGRGREGKREGARLSAACHRHGFEYITASVPTLIPTLASDWQRFLEKSYEIARAIFERYGCCCETMRERTMGNAKLPSGSAIIQDIRLFRAILQLENAHTVRRSVRIFCYAIRIRERLHTSSWAARVRNVCCSTNFPISRSATFLVSVILERRNTQFIRVHRNSAIPLWIRPRNELFLFPTWISGRMIPESSCSSRELPPFHHLPVSHLWSVHKLTVNFRRHFAVSLTDTLIDTMRIPMNGLIRRTECTEQSIGNLSTARWASVN